MGVMISQAGLDDLDQIAELFNQYRVFYEQEPDLDGGKSFLRDRMILRDSVIFVGRDVASNQYVGFCQLYPTFSSISMQRSWILNDLFVVVAYRKLGIGKLLLDEAARYAQQTGSKGLELATSADNTRAQKLYEEQGYQRDEQFYHYFLKV